MGKWMFVWVLVFQVSLFAQEPVSNGYDSEMQALINKVEGEKKKISIINDYKGSSDTEKAVSKSVEAYYGAVLREEMTQAYGMMIKQYRDYVTLNKFLGQKRLDMEKVHIKNIQIEGETCARVTGYIWGTDSGGKLGKLKIPIKKVFVLEEDGWHLFKDPFSNHMGFRHPKSRKFKSPCGF